MVSIGRYTGGIEVLRRPHTRLRELHKDLNELLSGPLSDYVVAKQKELQLKIKDLLVKDELFYALRGRVDWLHFGNQNTSYFQNFASAWCKTNFINKLKAKTGAWMEEEDQMAASAASYFEHLFATKVQNPSQDTISKIQPRISQGMNDALNASHTREGVKRHYLI